MIYRQSAGRPQKGRPQLTRPRAFSEWREHESAAMQRKWSRRDVLKAFAAGIGSAGFAQPGTAALPEAQPLTPDWIAAARKEGKIAFYSALELNISEKLARTFEARYPGITARVERSGAERIFQRIGQEQDSRINAVDLVCSTDPA